MKKTVLILCVFFCLFSCSENAVSPPKNKLSEATMEAILYDMALLQTIQIQFPDTLLANNIDMNEYIYKKYTIDSITYLENQRYYAADVENFKALHERVLEKIKLQQKQLDTLATTKTVETVIDIE